MKNQLITTGPKVDIKNVITPSGCRSRSRARRSTVRRQLRQSAKACLQANVSTLVKAIETVRWRAPARRSTAPPTPRRGESAGGQEESRTHANLRRAI